MYGNVRIINWKELWARIWKVMVVDCLVQIKVLSAFEQINHIVLQAIILKYPFETKPSNVCICIGICLVIPPDAVHDIALNNPLPVLCWATPPGGHCHLVVSRLIALRVTWLLNVKRCQCPRDFGLIIIRSRSIGIGSGSGSGNVVILVATALPIIIIHLQLVPILVMSPGNCNSLAVKNCVTADDVLSPQIYANRCCGRWQLDSLHRQKIGVRSECCFNDPYSHFI